MLYNWQDDYSSNETMTTEQTNVVAKLREQIEKLQDIANRACNLLNLKGCYHESYELRDEIQALKAHGN